MTAPNIGSREEWVEARLKLLDREKDLNRLRDELAEQRRQLPWVTTYSTYSRGLDPLNTAYQLLDLAPHGRDEDSLDWPMQWLRRHDAYDDVNTSDQ